MTSTTRARSFAQARLGPGALAGLVAALAALGGSLAVALISTLHGADGAPPPGSQAIDVTAAGLLILSTVPLAAWSRAPVAVFLLTATAATVLAALGYPIGIPSARPSPCTSWPPAATRRGPGRGP